MDEITILGGGPAGLSAAYFAEKNKLPFTLYEANNRVGGNCITYQHGDFYFDSGAHRFHDKDPEVTKEVRSVLGNDLLTSEARSQIYFDGQVFDFPLSPLNLLRTLGLWSFTRAGFELIVSRTRPLPANPSFEDFALHTYGKTIASQFLLNYSEKLWGMQSRNLSPFIAGTRMKGLNLKTFITEAFKGKDAKVKHLDGSFLYPKHGIGMIMNGLASSCSQNSLLTDSRITKIYYNHERIESLEVNHKRLFPVGKVISTLPLSLFIHLMQPAVPDEILQVAKGLNFRNLILVALFLNRNQISQAATMYFPEPHFPFTRIYEPKIRSQVMSPAGKTSLVAEIPCAPQSPLWREKDTDLVQDVSSALCEVLRFPQSQIIDTQVVRIPHAYPVLDIGFEEKVETILGFLNRFENLVIAGRNGMFNYTSIHDMIGSSKRLIESLAHASPPVETT